MKKFNILTYTKKIIDDLDNENLLITHLNIAYKVITYYNNNEESIGILDLSKLQNIVDTVYVEYMKSNDNDLLDEIIHELLTNQNKG